MRACINPVRQVVYPIGFWTVAPDVCGSSVWSLLYDSLMAPLTVVESRY